ncbi:hypothetical protein ACS0TY_032250 [Phlomoides rotata]
MGKKIMVSEAKTMAALKSHSEAERRRREKINAHLDTLRGLVPSNEKMDKATLLTEVINEVKQQKKTARQASEGLHIPMDIDEVQVEKLEKNATDGPFLLWASLCCEYQPDVLSNVRQAIDDLPVQFLKCEISTLGGRLKIVLLITATISEGNIDTAATQGRILNSVRVAFSSILDELSASSEYNHQLFFSSEKATGFLLGFSCSSSRNMMRVIQNVCKDWRWCCNAVVANCDVF